MIMRMFLIFGLVLLGVTGYFTVVVTPPNYQASPKVSEVALLQEKGLLPTGLTAENEELEHGIFDVPPMDEMMLEAAKASAGMNMGGMNMGGMDMSAGSSNATMTMADGSTMKASDMGTAATTPPANADMTMSDGSTMKMSDMGTAATTPPANADMTLADGSKMPMDTLPPAPDGLRFSDAGTFDREVTLAMSEWTFSDLQLDVKKGERIRFTVRNDGNILHEFMFMTMPAMAAVSYRAKRADWNLLEHEALFEQSLLLPGAQVSFIVEVQQDGNWMFMCMLPYHMQMGMMGQMATPGMAMKM